METNPQIPVYLHLVGDGQERAGWEALTDRYNLRDYVIFHGHRTGDELLSIFDKCQIGLSILGMYKMGMEAVSPLKTREYAAMGKPFVYANTELNIDETTPFCMRIANDATPLDINAVLEFYNRVKEIPQICEGTLQLGSTDGPGYPLRGRTVIYGKTQTLSAYAGFSNQTEGSKFYNPRTALSQRKL